MKYFPILLALAALPAANHLAAQPITFGPVKGKPGESIRLVTHSESEGGTIERRIEGRPESGTVSTKRERDLRWTFRVPAADGSRRGVVRVVKMSSVSTAKIGGEEEVVNDVSPLTGKIFSMAKSPAGKWSFELDGSFPLARVRSEIDELEVYLKRDWYPDHEVNLGDSWEFDPAWIKMIIERDLSKAQTIGTMRLRQVRRSANRNSALIDITILSTGEAFQADGSLLDGAVNLTGQVVVNLETMLDESLELKGTINTTSRKGGNTTVVKLPITLVATKSFFKGNMP